MTDAGRLRALRRAAHARAGSGGEGGAVGVLVRSLATASLRTPHTGVTVYEEGGRADPRGGRQHGGRRARCTACCGGGRCACRFSLGCRMLPDADSVNVVAEVRGREKPDEVVLLGAHLDSWDLGTGAQRRRRAAWSMVMEARPPDRRAAAAPAPDGARGALHERGERLRGGKGYAEAHQAELARHVAALETDSGADAARGAAPGRRGRRGAARALAGSAGGAGPARSKRARRAAPT